jgi:predicted  nucleic acid-binding Zn-ribbon protein
MASGGHNECGDCKVAVTGNEKGILCEICETWYHIKYQGVTEDTNIYLQKEQGIHWYCKGCDKGVAKVLKVISGLRKRQDKLEREVGVVSEEITEMRKKVQDIKQKQDKVEKEIKGVTTGFKKIEDHLEEKVRTMIKEEIQKRQEDVKAQMDESLKQITTEGRGNLWRDIVVKEVDDKFQVISSDLKETRQKVDETWEKVSEDLERIKRKNNIVIYNIPESEAAAYKDKVSEDKKFGEELLTDVLKVGYEEGNFKQLYRLCKMIEGRKRPLLAEFDNGRTKNLVMEFAGRLGGAEDKFKGVVISHDMTKVERQQCKNLVEEAKKLQADDVSGKWVFKVRDL